MDHEETNPGWPLAIDPTGCGCTECLTGEYVPLERATDSQLLDMLEGKRADNVGYITVEFARANGTWAGLLSFTVGHDARYASNMAEDDAERARRLTPDDIYC